MQSILTDTEFLAANAIMDYSLLTCIDESTEELVIGIIGEYRMHYAPLLLMMMRLFPNYNYKLLECAIYNY